MPAVEAQVSRFSIPPRDKKQSPHACDVLLQCTRHQSDRDVASPVPLSAQSCLVSCRTTSSQLRPFTVLVGIQVAHFMAYFPSFLLELCLRLCSFVSSGYAAYWHLGLSTLVALESAFNTKGFVRQLYQAVHRICTLSSFFLLTAVPLFASFSSAFLHAMQLPKNFGM